MTEISCIIVGAGAMAREHIRVLQLIEGVKIAGVCDLSAEKAHFTADRFDIPFWFNDYKSMLSKITAQVAHVITPPSSHMRIVEDCLNANLHVLCEKPITLTFEDFKRLKGLAERKSLTLLENQNLRFHSTVANLIGRISKGEFGSILDVCIQISLPIYEQDSPYIDPFVTHFSAELPGGVIGDFLPHISYLAIVFCDDPKVLSTHWDKRSLDSHFPADEFRAHIQSSNSSAYVGFSGNTKVPGFWLRVTGSELVAEADLYNPPKILFRRQRHAPPPLPTLANGTSEAFSAAVGSFNAAWRKLAGKSSYDGLHEFFYDTYQALRQDEPQRLTLKEIERSVRLVSELTADIKPS